jgi:hypothetical protein
MKILAAPAGKVSLEHHRDRRSPSVISAAHQPHDLVIRRSAGRFSIPG